MPDEQSRVLTLVFTDLADSCFSEKRFTTETRRSRRTMAGIRLLMDELPINELSSRVIGAAIEVHRALGPGLLESAYEKCLCRELSIQELPFERQRELPVEYKGEQLDCGYRIDILVDGRLIVELKAVETVSNLHKAQLMTYLKLSDCELGLLINFNVPVLINGISRVSMGAPNL